MALDRQAFVRLDGAGATLVLSTAPAPFVLYWGPALSPLTDETMLALVGAREEANASPSVEAPLALTPLVGQGSPSRPGLLVHRGGQAWATYAELQTIDREPDGAVLTSRDDASGLTLRHRLKLDPGSGVLRASTELINDGAEPLTVQACAAPVLPVPSAATRLVGFEGRWAGEFQTRAVERSMGVWLRENRRGRTSHDAFPAVVLTDPRCGESQGLAYGFHLGWSGNHQTAVETFADGRASVQMGELLLPGELQLAPGGRYTSPEIFAACSNEGLNGLSRAFHRFLRARPEHARLRAKPRPVHYNTWEAVYFNHDPAVLHDLAERAARAGVERFVLDDGWFKGRRNDAAGLGDWTVDPAVHPDGLAPLIARVRSLGMEFGLWVEPESVNADSDLHRAHPDWALATPHAPPVPFRNQMVLDLSRAEVRDHLFERLDALLREHDISYLKWDFNRDISQPGSADGRAVAHQQVLGVYELFDRVRAAHPDVEVESCASGGARADFGVLARTDRVWTSDSNDALDRLAIQRGFSLFVPAELMGAHVGPRDGHITGRRVSMAMRAAVAMFGHMGLELDLREAEGDEFAELVEAIALHKSHRALIHSGDLVRLETAAEETAFGVVAPDRSEALFAYYAVAQPRAYFPPRLHLAGLDGDAVYDVKLVWPTRIRSGSPLIAALRDGAALSGDALMKAGLQSPRLHPQSGLVLHLSRRPS